MHPLLLPGTHVVRRGPDELQAGLSAGRVALPGRQARLEELHSDPRSIATLRRAGLVLDDDRLLRGALPPQSSPSPWPRHTLAATARRVPGSFQDTLAERSRRTIRAVPFGHPLSRLLADDLNALLVRGGLRLSPTRPRPGDAEAEPGEVRVLVGVGEPRRERVDELVRDGEPHLVVRLLEGRAVLGPFVVPGRTSCLRCTDAYLTEADPAWPLLVEQYARATSHDRADGVPEPVDAALAAVAIGWAARDVATHVEGGLPSSWSTTITLAPDLSEVSRRTWPAHPHCGCAWP